jgi:hypothetical protein
MTETVRTSIPEADLIAERELELVSPTGEAGKLHVRIARPVSEAEGGWSCGLHLAEVEDRVTELSGEDSMQALVHALYIIPVLIGQLRAQGFRVTLEGHDELLLAEFPLPGAGLG